VFDAFLKKRKRRGGFHEMFALSSGNPDAAETMLKLAWLPRQLLRRQPDFICRRISPQSEPWYLAFSHFTG
jgi:hypothetical protein